MRTQKGRHDLNRRFIVDGEQGLEQTDAGNQTVIRSGTCEAATTTASR